MKVKYRAVESLTVKGKVSGEEESKKQKEQAER